ncbi:hypothetical protein ACQKWADRAFT_320562 [Trichoderma austrokoningii]
MFFAEAETATLPVDQVVLMYDADLAERLDSQKRGSPQSPTTYSRPLDLDDLDARLRRISLDNSFLLRPEPQAIDWSWPPTPVIDETRIETEAYNELNEDSGYMFYSIDFIQDVHRAPDKDSKMLPPWEEGIVPASLWGIFQRRMRSWQYFRKWQSDHRGHETDDGGFSAYVERQKRWIQKGYPPRSRAERLAEIEADPSCLKSGWKEEQSLRERQRRLYEEFGCRGLRDYAEAVKRQLARHGFTQPFELDEDPKKQDRLTTWIEYLSYQYWWLDEYIRDTERLEPEHDKLWQELVDDKILWPHETKEFVRIIASLEERLKEDHLTRETLRKTESRAIRNNALTQVRRIPQAKRTSMLNRGAEKLCAARRRYEQIRSHNYRIMDFISATFGYADAKRDTARHRIFVQLVLDQVPLIEAEMNPSKADRPGSEGRKMVKRGRATDEESLEGRSPKKLRFTPQEPRL